MKIGLRQGKDICYNSLNYFLGSIEKALNDRGVETQRISDFNKDVLMQKWDAMIGINSNLPVIKLENGTFFMDYFNCPVFNILVDPPYYHHTILESHMDNLHVIVLDEGHVEYCEKYYAPFKSVEMAYLLGPIGKGKAYEDKKIDILFTGSIPNENEARQQASQIYNAEWADAIFELLIQIGINQPDCSTYKAIEEILKQSDVNCSDSELKLIMHNLGSWAEFYLRGYYRKKIITTLVDAGLCVHVAGNGWDNLYSECPGNLILEGNLDFAQMADLTANSKIVLNVMPWFKDGIHDRILTAMLNGSVCVTDSSSYIDTHFKEGQELVIYGLDDIKALPDKIEALLKDEEKARLIAEKGKEKATKNYSWDLFVENYILKHL